MRKKLAYLTLAGFVAIVLTFTAFFAWLLGTPGGARWLFSVISRQTTIRIQAEKIEGRLWGDLDLAGVLISWPSGTLGAGNCHMEWRPLRLLTATVSVKQLFLKDLRIQDNRTETPMDLKWPAMSGLPSYIAAKVGDLKIDGLVYRRLNQAPVVIDEFSSGVLWRRGVLHVRDFSVRTSSASGKGSIRAGFGRPSLDLDLSVILSKPLEQMDHLSLSAHFLPGKAPVQLEGPLEVIGMTGAKPRLKLSLDAGIERESVLFRKMNLTEAGRRGAVGGSGEITFTPRQAELQLSIKIDNLDLSPQVPAGTDLSGEVTLHGSLADYRGEFSLSNKGGKWRSAAMSGSFKGDRKGVDLHIAKSSLLDGSLTGTVGAQWHNGISFSAKIRGRGLNPSTIHPEWKGIVNLDLEAAADLPGKYPEGNIHAQLLKSRLHGKALSGSVDADFAKGDLLITHLFLRGKGFDLQAEGDLKRRIAFLANITDLSELIPEAAGALKTDGWVRWKEGLFSGSVKASGRHIIFSGAKIAGLDLTGYLSDRKGYSVNLMADIRKFEYKNMLVNEMTAKVSGTALQHEITVDAGAANTLALHTKLTGSYDHGAWKGEIDRLSVHDSVGSFALRSPAEIRISPERIFLDPLVLKGGSTEELKLSADITRNPLNGSFKALWSQVNLAHLNPWIKNIDISGKASGTADAEWREGKIEKAESGFSASGAFTVRQQHINVDDVSGNMVWGSNGLQTSFQLKLSEGGMLSCRINSPAPVRMGLPESGEIDAKWRSLNLALAGPLLPEKMRVSGKSSGNLHARWQENGVSTIGAGMDASGALTIGGRETAIKSFSLNLTWNEHGLSSSIDTEIKGGGKFQAHFTSPAKPHPGFPAQGEISMDWREFNLASLQPWLSKEIVPKGMLSGRADGRLLPGNRIDMSGDIAVTGGSLVYRTAYGMLSAEMQTADLKWTWQGKTLQGDVSLVLEKYGSLKGHLALPLPARIPVSLDRSGKVEGSFSGKVQENGLLTSLFPGLVQETHGDIILSLNVGGTMDNPLPEGTLQLTNAGAYFVAAGIRINNLFVKAHLDANRISVDTFGMESGSGKLGGSATLHLKQWHMTNYEGTIKGTDFQCIHLPEYRLSISPDLTVEGTPKKVSVKGEIKIPYLLVYGPQTREPVQPSKDVVIVERRHEAARKSPLAVNMKVHIILGDRAFVKAEGIDAQLKGGIFVTARDLDNIRGKGAIDIEKGTYKRYGIDLKITRGRVLFSGVPVENPTLDVLAIRTVEDIKAGVLVSGTLKSPLIKLYSDPAMPDTDILSYIVLGHATGQSKQDTSLMEKAAGFLLSKGESVVLQDQLKQKLGIDVLDVETSQTTSPTTGETTSRSLVTIGKYLTPKLYISYGHALLSNENLVRLRYNLTKRLQIQSESGTASGADLIYKIDFK